MQPPGTVNKKIDFFSLKTEISKFLVLHISCSSLEQSIKKFERFFIVVIIVIFIVIQKTNL